MAAGVDSMKYDCIIWDWNGTLLDDVSASLSSVNDMLRERGMQEMDIVRYRECIGIPIKVFYEHVFDLSKEDYGQLLAQYNEGYLRHLGGCGLSAGSREALDYFRNAGSLQIIVSSSNNSQLTENVEKYGITEYFDAILGSDNYLAESKIERAEKYIASHGISSPLVIGDLEHDCVLAREVGADCVLLTSGHEKTSRLKKSGARVVDSLTEMLDKIR